MSLYNKYRPQTIDDIVGNRRVKSYLSNFSETTHTLLFSGLVGTGKTSVARIVARRLGAHIEELNISDNNGVDMARELVERIQYRGFHNRTVYILDECHRLTRSAQNILLKVLEEPPEHAYIFLVTTEPEGLIATVRSRCVPIKMEPPDKKDSIVFLNTIAVKEKISLADGIIEQIYKGGVTPRTMLSLLESLRGVPEDQQQVGSYEEVEEKELISLARILLNNSDWSRIAYTLERLPQAQPYSIVKVTLAYVKKVLLKQHDTVTATIFHRFLELKPDCTFDHIINTCSIIYTQLRRNK